MVSIWTPLAHRQSPSAGSACRTSLYFSPVPIITAAIALADCGARCGAIRDYVPFIGAMGLFAMCYLGLGISLFPYVVPHAFTLWQAAAVASAQAFLLIGTLFLLPIIFMYTGWSYYVFRGKVKAELGYH